MKTDRLLTTLHDEEVCDEVQNHLATNCSFLTLDSDFLIARYAGSDCKSQHCSLRPQPGVGETN